MLVAYSLPNSGFLPNLGVFYTPERVDSEQQEVDSGHC